MSEREAVVAAFAGQLAVDMSGIGTQQRQQLSSVLGDNVFRTVVAVFIADFVPRVWAGLEALGLGTAGKSDAVVWDQRRRSGRCA